MRVDPCRAAFGREPLDRGGPRILHDRADEGVPESREGRRILRAVQIGSERHGFFGVADVVEIRDGIPYPVEYKLGRPKAHRADEVQLSAQALCLEEMTGKRVAQGALFYGRNRRRKPVAIDTGLRELTLQVAAELRHALDTGELPAPAFDPRRCNACSMQDLCRPQAVRSPGSTWLARRIARAGVPE